MDATSLPGEAPKMNQPGCNQLYLLFASLLEYPTVALQGAMKDAGDLLSCACPQVTDTLARFKQSLGQVTTSQLQETYTHTFDLHGVCVPYIGYHLFGDGYQRAWFMSQLNQRYRQVGFKIGNELPDHVAVVLRFLALGDQDEFSLVLLDEGLIPALHKMSSAFDKDSNNPYKQVVLALTAVLEGFDGYQASSDTRGGSEDD